MSATQRGSVLLGMIIGASLALGYTELSVRFGSTARLFQTTGDRIPAVDDPRRAVRRASVGGTVSREAKANRLATPAVAVEDEAWVRMRLTRGDIEEWLGSTPETEGWSGSYAKPHDGTKLMVQPWGDRKVKGLGIACRAELCCPANVSPSPAMSSCTLWAPCSGCQC